MNTLTQAPELSWSETWSRIDSVTGWLTEDEAKLLYDVARNSAVSVVEIGAWLGRSTAALAFGIRSSSPNPGSRFVVSVDTWKGSKNASEESLHEKLISDLGVTDLRPLHQENLERLELADWSCQLQGRSVPYGVRWARAWIREISMLFIDGCHEYEEVKQDFESWAPLVVLGGSVLFHDAWAPGPSRVISEVPPNFRRLPGAGELAHFVKNSS